MLLNCFSVAATLDFLSAACPRAAWRAVSWLQRPIKCNYAAPAQMANQNLKPNFVKTKQIQLERMTNQPNPKKTNPNFHRKPSKSKSPSEKTNQIQRTKTQTKDRACDPDTQPISAET